MNNMQIAELTHEVNRAYCQAIGDDSQLPWNSCPAWQKESAIEGVIFALTNPAVTPEEMHINWMIHKTEDGWTYGEEKDPENKLHPCMVPYHDLPVEQQVKDHLFQAIVKIVSNC